MLSVARSQRASTAIRLDNQDLTPSWILYVEYVCAPKLCSIWCWSLSSCGCDGLMQIGKDHAKWNPCATAYYQFQPDIRINHALMDTLTLQEKEEWVNHWPSKAVKLNSSTGQVCLMAILVLLTIDLNGIQARKNVNCVIQYQDARKYIQIKIPSITCFHLNLE